MTARMMHVVCLAPTGHVLAAVAASNAGEAPKLEALTGPVLNVTAKRSTRTGTAGIRAMASPIPIGLLELKTAPYDAGTIANPLDYAIDGGEAVNLPDGPPPQNALPLSANTITMAGGAADTIGLSVVCDAGNPAGQRRIQSGKFTADNLGVVQPLILPLSLMPGDTPAGLVLGNDYDILHAIQGIRLFWGADVA